MKILGSHHFTKLAQDYVAAFSSSAVKEFFPLAPTERGEMLRTLIKNRIARESTSEAKACRKDLIIALRSQHTNAGTLTAKVEENLVKLAGDKCLAVVTGQQTGILGGPPYTVFKALHTIILAKELEAKFPEYQFVPVFWQETEDHDLEETTWVDLVTQDFTLKKVRYEPKQNADRAQIGKLKLEKESLDEFFSQITELVAKTDFSYTILSFYQNCYKDGTTFAEAQAKFLGALLSDDGLLILDPNFRELKKYAAPLFEKEILTAPELSDTIQNVSKKLVAGGYHAQLDPQGANLFLAENGKRYKVTKEDGAFHYDDKTASQEDLLVILKNEPERFSMNVVMRPLVQDTILPTVAYVAGPGEIAYFAQLKAAYDWAGIEMPLIAPRIGFTFVEDRFEKLLQKYSIEKDAFLEDGNEIVKRLLESEQEKIIAERFATASDGLDKVLELVRGAVRTAEPTLDGALTTLKGKLITGLKDFEGKTLAAERKKQSGIKQQFEKALAVVIPEGKLQERKLNLLYFLNKYGFDFWKKFKDYAYKGSIRSGDHTAVSVSELLK
jgi:bacillithiol biosynthesis cysteine-adding enzyme BshC